MDGEQALYLGQELVKVCLLVTAPVLIVTIMLGLGVAMLQAVTSIRDMTLAMVLKLAGVGVTLLLCSGWMMTQAISFTTQVLNTVGGLTR